MSKKSGIERSEEYFRDYCSHYAKVQEASTDFYSELVMFAYMLFVEQQQAYKRLMANQNVEIIQIEDTSVDVKKVALFFIGAGTIIEDALALGQKENIKQEYHAPWTGIPQNLLDAPVEKVGGVAAAGGAALMAAAKYGAVTVAGAQTAGAVIIGASAGYIGGYYQAQEYYEDILFDIQEKLIKNDKTIKQLKNKIVTLKTNLDLQQDELRRNMVEVDLNLLPKYVRTVYSDQEQYDVISWKLYNEILKSVGLESYNVELFLNKCKKKTDSYIADYFAGNTNLRVHAERVNALHKLYKMKMEDMSNTFQLNFTDEEINQFDFISIDSLNDLFDAIRDSRKGDMEKLVNFIKENPNGINNFLPNKIVPNSLWEKPNKIETLSDDVFQNVRKANQEVSNTNPFLGALENYIFAQPLQGEKFKKLTELVTRINIKDELVSRYLIPSIDTYDKIYELVGTKEKTKVLRRMFGDIQDVAEEVGIPEFSTFATTLMMDILLEGEIAVESEQATDSLQRFRESVQNSRDLVDSAEIDLQGDETAKSHREKLFKIRQRYREDMKQNLRFLGSAVFSYHTRNLEAFRMLFKYETYAGPILRIKSAFSKGGIGFEELSMFEIFAGAYAFGGIGGGTLAGIVSKILGGTFSDKFLAGITAPLWIVKNLILFVGRTTMRGAKAVYYRNDVNEYNFNDKDNGKSVQALFNWYNDAFEDFSNFTTQSNVDKLDFMIDKAPNAIKIMLGNFIMMKKFEVISRDNYRQQKVFLSVLPYVFLKYMDDNKSKFASEPIQNKFPYNHILYNLKGLRTPLDKNNEYNGPYHYPFFNTNTNIDYSNFQSIEIESLINQASTVNFFTSDS